MTLGSKSFHKNFLRMITDEHLGSKLHFTDGPGRSSILYSHALIVKTKHDQVQPTEILLPGAYERKSQEFTVQRQADSSQGPVFFARMRQEAVL
jgi:hypothetical protein